MLGAIVAIAVLVVFPVQVLTIAMLFAIATMTMSIYVLWQRLHPSTPAHRAALERRLPAVTGILLAAGTVVGLAWPTIVAPVAFGLTVASCLTLLGFELAAGRAADHDVRRQEHRSNA